METLLNCVWLVVGLSLITAWSAHVWGTRTSDPSGLLPSRRLQFTALLLLVVLLFPVISLTDDIAICTATRYSERTLRFHDLIDSSQPAQATLPATMAWMDLVAIMWRSGPSRPVEQDAGIFIRLTGTRLPVDSRPPPVSL